MKEVKENSGKKQKREGGGERASEQSGVICCVISPASEGPGVPKC